MAPRGVTARLGPESFFRVALLVEDLGESLAFYREHFGADLLERGAADEEGNEYAALAVADERVHLFDRAPYESAAPVDPLPAGVPRFGYVVEDVDAASAPLADVCVEFLVESTTFGDLRIAFLYDPDGVRIELLEHLA